MDPTGPASAPGRRGRTGLQRPSLLCHLQHTPSRSDARAPGTLAHTSRPCPPGVHAGALSRQPLSAVDAARLTPLFRGLPASLRSGALYNALIAFHTACPAHGAPSRQGLFPPASSAASPRLRTVPGEQPVPSKYLSNERIDVWDLLRPGLDSNRT